MAEYYTTKALTALTIGMTLLLAAHAAPSVVLVSVEQAKESDDDKAQDKVDPEGDSPFPDLDIKDMGSRTRMRS